MPAARTDVDESGIAARVALQGIRPTARATGLPVATVRDIAKRQGVSTPSPEQRLVVARPLRPHSTSTQPLIHTPSTQPAHAVITDELTQRGASSRLNAARIGDTTLAAIASEPAERQIALLGAANESASLLVKSNVPGWERRDQAQPAQVVNIALLGIEPGQCVLEIPASTVVPGSGDSCAVPDQA